MTTSTLGLDTGGKTLNLAQLEAEIVALGAQVVGLGTHDAFLFTYDQGQPADFAAADVPLVQQALNAHVALRDKTDAEYATEFQDAATSAARKQEIRDITAGLLPREQVPM
jgi:hypothetical protein